MTFVAYPNVKARSDGGKYRVEIRGEKAEKDFFRDQSNFVYRLFAANASNPLWEWRPSRDEWLGDYPHEAWVSDEGFVVARLHEWFHAGLLVLSPAGECRMYGLLQGFREDETGLMQDEPDSHIGSTSAGPTWEASSIPQFQSDGRARCWSILTWWGRRVVVDLDAGRLLEKVPEALEARLEGAERDWILGMLDQDLPLDKPADDAEPTYWRQRERHYSAAFHAGLKGMREAVPLLRELESCALTGGHTSNMWFNIETLPFRLIAKISLLRMGVEPRWFANYTIRESCDAGRTFPDRSKYRSPLSLENGLTQREVLEKLTAPEFLDHRDAWDYSIFEDGSTFTVRVHWHDRHKHLLQADDPKAWSSNYEVYKQRATKDPPVVSRIERIERPAWQLVENREYCLAHP